MRKEWISYLNFSTRRTEQKMEQDHQINRREKYMMRNSTNIHFHNFYGQLYSNWLRTRRMTQYLW